MNGDVFRGEIASAAEDGVVFRLEEGGFSPRVDYAKFTDETLKTLSEMAKLKKFVDPFLSLAEVEKVILEAKQIPVRQPPRLERPQVQAGLWSALTSPDGIVLLGALFLANLYAAWAVAHFRHRPVALVCGLSAILPVVAPIIFLALHKSVPQVTHDVDVETGPVTMAPGAESSPGNRVTSLGTVKSSSSGGAGDLAAKHFKRGETTFNRRFFETQFPTFFRVVSSEADKDMVLAISAGPKSCVALRISRISSTEVHFKTSTGGEIGVDFALISEISVRHKDAKA
ncbi:MAG: hypothetical protein EXS36_05060 [Pedosphaera sp.]|nr:hypothetical protein [Pedosphaera sp.]